MIMPHMDVAHLPGIVRINPSVYLDQYRIIRLEEARGPTRIDTYFTP